MEARDEDNCVIHYAVEEPVWKPMHEGTASFAVYDRIRFGPIKNCFNGIPNLREELLTERLTLRLIPSVSPRDVGRCRGTEDVIAHRDRARI
jgi:hypothetical protein